MSEHLTHVAVYEDTVRLIKANRENFPKIFTQSVEECHDSGLFCSGSRGNHLYAIPIIEKFKNRKPESFSTRDKEQIAGAIGWLTHRASDLQMKPIFGIIEKGEHPVFHDNECQMFHDAVMFKEVYKGGTLSSKSPYQKFSPATLAHGMKGNPAADYLNVPLTENVFTHYFLSEMAGLQHFINELDDVDEYCDLLIENSQNLYEDLRIYIDAFQSPDYHKLVYYIHNFNVYDEEDALIKIVRDIQINDKFPLPERLQEALSTADQQSQYAQALKKGYDYLIGAGKFYNNEISKAQVYDIIENFNEKHRI